MVELIDKLNKRLIMLSYYYKYTDELIFEVPAMKLKILVYLLKIMEHALQLDVPLKVDSNYGSTWYDAK